MTIAGCAARQHAERTDPPSEISVRFPPAESPKVDLRTEEPKAFPEEDTSLTDDTRRPWLKLIEVDVAPATPDSSKEGVKAEE
jgi:hypothetical protein